MKYSEVAFSLSASGVPLLTHSEGFVPWQPITWPPVPDTFSDDFLCAIERIFRETIINEIDNVISDSNGQLKHRGHVIAISQLCAIDALSSYAFYGVPKYKCTECKRGDSIRERYKKFITEFFPEDYKRYDTELYCLYRNAMVHSWNLFEVTIFPGNERVETKKASLSFGLINFQSALKLSLDDFLKRLKIDSELQMSVISRYAELKNSAKP